MAKIARLICVLMAVVSPVKANVLFSETWQAETGAPKFDTTTLNNWNVNAGNVDVYAPVECAFSLCLDLAGTTANGDISTKTAFNIVSGVTYTLSFLLSNNPNPDGSPNTATVSMGSFLTAQSLSSTSIGQETFTFTPSSSGTASIRFIETEAIANNFGLLLDNITLSDNSVPEPSSVILSLTGLILLVRLLNPGSTPAPMPSSAMGGPGSFRPKSSAILRFLGPWLKPPFLPCRCCVSKGQSPANS